MAVEGIGPQWTWVALGAVLWSNASCGARSLGGLDDRGPAAGDDADLGVASEGASSHEDGSETDASFGPEANATAWDGSPADDSDVPCDAVCTADEDSAAWDSAILTDAGSMDDDGANPQDAGIGVQGRPMGQPCVASSDCASAICAAAECVDAASCLALLIAEPGLPDREYEIDPDGAGQGMAPFVAYCDMTTDGGGWTTLPLRFSDPSFWSITQAGEACVSIDVLDDQGDFHQYQSAEMDSFASTYMTFVPPIAAQSVRFVDFEHTNGGSNNTMDFWIGGLPPASDTSFEGWYFADPSAPGVPVGYAFPTAASCVAPYDVEYYVTCSRDALAADDNAPTAPFPLSETVALASTIPSFEMGLIQGCPSYPLLPLITGEQFRIAVPPAPDGVWVTGIAIR